MDRLPSEYLLVRVGPPVRGALTLRDLTDREVAEVYAASDVLLFPTLEEGFGLPIIEAFASGLPVVASDIAVVQEAAAGSALLVDPRDPHALAVSCRAALDDRTTLERRGLLRAQEFTLERLSIRLHDFYAKLTEQSTPSARSVSTTPSATP
jgi:glycosyltransferase involved in cell wall biosynthesis